MLILSLLLLLCVLGSWFFSGSETGFVTCNPLKVSHAAAQGDFTARLAMRLMNRRGQLISVILIGNNVCNVGAALIFVRFFEHLDALVALDLSRIPSPESIFLTPVLLFFGEILPKSLYRTYPFRLTMKSVPFLTALFYLTSPLFWVFGLMSKVFGGRFSGSSRSVDVREEIVLVAVEGAKRGSIFEGADQIMKNTLGMKGVSVSSISVPLDEWKRGPGVYRMSQTLSEFGACAGGAAADEVVVFDDALKAPVGYVSLLDAAAHSRDGMRTFGELLKPLPRLKGGMEMLYCLRRMRPGSPRYHLVVSGDAAVGLLDKMSLFGAAFAKTY
jgi:CBS domain containing-hemolysin-like protein